MEAGFIGVGEEFELVRYLRGLRIQEMGDWLSSARKASVARQRIGAATGHSVMGRKEIPYGMEMRDNTIWYGNRSELISTFKTTSKP